MSAKTGRIAVRVENLSAASRRSYGVPEFWADEEVTCGTAQIGFGIYDRAQILLQHPEAGTLLDELREGGWRKLIYRRWKIIYAVCGEVIIIGRV